MTYERSDELLISLRRIIRAISLHSKKLEQKYGLTGPQVLLLKEINLHANIPVSVLAKNVNLSKPTVTSILDRLEKKGYITRTKDLQDRRKVLVQAKANANKIFSKAPSLLQESFIENFNQLEEWEQSLMVSTLQRISSMMNAETIDAAPVLTAGEF
ncbi:MAG: MarR family winged helix-turn-helix transcriptional regulator [Gammaproteobacteria bacterium]